MSKEIEQLQKENESLRGRVEELERELESLGKQASEKIQSLEQALETRPDETVTIKLDNRVREKMAAGLSLEQATIAVAEQKKADALARKKQ